MNVYLACMVVVLSVGASVIWSNPRNLVSQALAFAAIVTLLWIYLFWLVTTPWAGDPLPWLRAIAVVGGFFPALIWWVGRCAVVPHGSWRDFLVEGRYWHLAASLLGAVALSPWFLPPESTPQRHLYGILYFPHQVGQVLVFLALPAYAATAIARLRGFERSMAKLFFIGGGVTTLVTACFTIVLPLVRPGLARGAPVVASVFFLTAAWALSSQQLLDTRHHMVMVLRRTLGLIATAFVITWLLEQTWALPREVQLLGAAASGISLALILDSLSGALLDNTLAKDSLKSARALQHYTTTLAAQPAAELHTSAAPRLAQILSTREVAVYWRSSDARRLRLVSAHRIPAECPETIGGDHKLVQQSAREHAPWWLSRRLTSVEPTLGSFALCVPVVEQNQILLLVLTGHKQGPLGYSQAELSALQSWALACHHTLTTRALLERENAQQQLVYAGKLAAGIAHNIRNPLAIVRAYLEADPAIPRTELRELHELALTESARIQSTIDGLTALSRGERFILVPRNLDALVHRAAELNAPYLAECRATVEIVGDAATPSVLAEPWQLTTALTNLLRNSAEEVAREGGGWIRIEFGRAAPGWLELRIRDSGRGLPEHIRDAVFSRDLFAQTTKPTTAPSRRTGFGIGLHSTMLIVTIGHGGRFEYRDNAFVLTLPAAPSAPGGK